MGFIGHKANGSRLPKNLELNGLAGNGILEAVVCSGLGCSNLKFSVSGLTRTMKLICLFAQGVNFDRL